ncbi:DUF222 domain-containing protein [Ilumatobacter sp.]|uniref:HNH endonuclease signature motif containing protein n=1 Tax=Ilumatobacter sp. TaxID=1967498 RepID=UPI003B518CA4
MDRSVVEACDAAVAARVAGPTPEVTETTRALRRVRAAQLDEVRSAVESGRCFQHGYRSPADWLASTTNEAIGHCRVTIRLADRIQHLPIVKDAFSRGDLAEGSLRLLCDAWDPTVAITFARDEAMLCRWATTLPHREVKMLLDTWRMHADPDREERAARERYDRRELHLSPMLDGMGRIDGTLDPEGFALVREAVRSLSHRATDDDDRSAPQRRADALVTMAKMAITSTEANPAPGRSRRAPKVLATIGYDTLASGIGGGVIDTNDDRVVVPAEAIRRMACDAGIHRYVTDTAGTVIDHGRSRRTVGDLQFDRLVVRDHGCRVAGCTTPAAGCEAHHAVHWVDGGPTTDDNLILLCWHHHHVLHEHRWRLEPHGAGHFTLRDENGTERTLRPPLVGLALPAPTLQFPSAPSPAADPAHASAR